MAADKALNLQMQVRRNTEELGDFLKDLDRWEDDIKSKDEDLKISKTSGSTVGRACFRLPPVRNQAKKKKVKKNKDVSKDQKMKSRISSYDYRSWDKLNVDELINDLEEKEEMETLTSSDDGDGDEMLDDDDEQAEEERRLQRALLEKDKGNDFFKIGRYKEAINCYTTAMQLDPNNAIFPANRAMALLKVERHGAAELDCDLALSLDYSYTKAYLRRGKARSHLNKLHESLSDFKEALRLEPGNKQAQQEILNLKQVSKPCVIFCVHVSY
ncbi:predicted protein [Nematostella vectensis]|uniref:RNA polymerase II-associated protein 3 n=1 Tax=Nematostella vectensis TaxID=45351 RepID=A7T0P9_NEMVE|nr:predicted protein [Nematostella vectensis]|eukprot:XP_001622568.1 predicted protein [Nematostella vectensis]